MYNHGNQKQQKELKEIDENIQIDGALLKRYRYRLLNFSLDTHETRVEIDRLEQKIADELVELRAAPVEIEKLEKRLVNHHARRDMLTGKITGHSKMINKLHKMQADMVALEKEIAESQSK